MFKLTATSNYQININNPQTLLLPTLINTLMMSQTQIPSQVNQKPSLMGEDLQVTLRAGDESGLRSARANLS